MKLYAAGKTEEGNPKLSHSSQAILTYVHQDEKSKPRGLFIIADSFGSGISKTLSKTSQLAIEVIYLEFTEFLERGDFSEPLESYLKKKLHLAFETVHLELQNNAQDPAQSKISVSMTAICVYGELAVIASVGDIRAYHIHDRELHQLTEDHTFDELIKKKNLKVKNQTGIQKEYQNILTKALGVGNDLEIDIFTQLLVPDDKLFLCNSSIWQKLSDAELLNLLLELDHPEVVVQKIIDAAQDYWGELSAIVVEVMIEK